MDPQRLAIFLNEKIRTTGVAPSGQKFVASHTLVREYNNKQNAA